MGEKKEKKKEKKLRDRNYQESGTVTEIVKHIRWIFYLMIDSTASREKNEMRTWTTTRATFLIWFSLDAPILLIRRLDETIKTISFFSTFTNDADIGWFLSSSWSSS